MGRRKLKIAKLESLTAQKAMFKKRHGGVVKKASELATLCDIDIGLICFSPEGTPKVFLTKPIKDIVTRLANSSHADTSICNEDLEKAAQNLTMMNESKGSVRKVLRRVDQQLPRANPSRSSQVDLQKIQMLNAENQWPQEKIQNLNARNQKLQEARLATLIQRRRELQEALEPHVAKLTTKRRKSQEAFLAELNTKKRELKEAEEAFLEELKTKKRKNLKKRKPEAAEEALLPKLNSKKRKNLRKRKLDAAEEALLPKRNSKKWELQETEGSLFADDAEKMRQRTVFEGANNFDTKMPESESGAGQGAELLADDVDTYSFSSLIPGHSSQREAGHFEWDFVYPEVHH